MNPMAGGKAFREPEIAIALNRNEKYYLENNARIPALSLSFISVKLLDSITIIIPHNFLISSLS